MSFHPDPKVDAFLEELDAVAKKHGMIVAADGREMDSTVEDYSADWLKQWGDASNDWRKDAIAERFK